MNRRGVHYILCMALSVPCLYVVGFAGVYFPIYLLYTIGTLRWSEWITLISKQDPVLCLLTLLLVLQIISLVWSPNAVLGIREIIYTLPAVALILHMQSPVRLEVIYRGAHIYLAAATVQALLVIIFRISPSIEDAFLNSALAPVFINPNQLSEFIVEANNNVKDPDKAGGLLLNGNIAACWAICLCYLALAIHIRRPRRSLIWIAIIQAVSVAASGSKAALVLLPVTPFLVYAIFVGRQKLILISAVLLTTLGLYAFSDFKGVIPASLASDAIMDDAATNLFRRQLIWQFAYDQFIENPLLGLGFGGWAESFSGYGGYYIDLGLHDNMAAHNSLIMIWSQSGLLAALSAIGIFFYLIRGASAGDTGYGTKRLFPEKKVSLVMSMSVPFVIFMQSMGENFLLSEPHLQAVLVLAYGLTVRELKGQQ